MQFHMLACSFICLHAVSYACKQFHEFACSSLEISISLSSSQELHSACQLSSTPMWVKLVGYACYTSLHTHSLSCCLKNYTFWKNYIPPSSHCHLTRKVIYCILESLTQSHTTFKQAGLSESPIKKTQTEDLTKVIRQVGIISLVSLQFILWCNF